MALFLLAGGDSLAGHGYLEKVEQLAMKIGFWTRLLSVVAAVFLGSAGAHEWYKLGDRSTGQWKIGVAIGFLAMSTLGAEPHAPKGPGTFLDGWGVTESKN